MLYVGCGRCRSVVPLFCGGQYMPHMPLYAEAGPLGIYCPCCGPTQPVFTCTVCGMMQMLYLPGAHFAPQMMPAGAPRTVAPVVRAQAGAGENQIRSLLMSAGKSFLSEFAGHAGGHFGDQFASAASDYMSSWFGGSDAWSGGGGQNW